MVSHVLSRRITFQTYRISQAVKDLPGPNYPWLLGYFDLLTRRDVHRFATELAERFGPIFKFRIICFHVRDCPVLYRTCSGCHPGP